MDWNWTDPISKLEQAIIDDNLESVKLAIAEGIDPNCEEEAPLLVATVRRRKEIAQFLLEAGADPNVPHMPGWSCLTEAVVRNDLEWVDLLSRYGARVGAATQYEDATELHKAARDGNLDMG